MIDSEAATDPKRRPRFSAGDYSLEAKDGEVDYSECSLAELRDVEAQINRQSYPKNFANLQRAIANRLESQQPTTETEARSIYSSVGQRIGAQLLDILIILPIIVFGFWAGSQSRVFDFYFLPFMALFNLWYNVYLVKRYGGTPGKLLLDLKVVKLEGDPIGYNEALLRYAVLLLLTIAGQVGYLQAMAGMTDAEYYSLNWTEKVARIQELAPDWVNTIRLITNIWLVAQLITMIANTKRRAVHDYIAGTVVIRS